MAGYFTKNEGYIYEGEVEALAAGLENGMFVRKIDGKFELNAAPALPVGDPGLVLEVIELTTFNDKPAVRANVVAHKEQKFYMVEKIPFNDTEITADGEVIIKAGELVRARVPQVNEQLMVNVPADVVFVVGSIAVPVPATGYLALGAAVPGFGG